MKKNDENIKKYEERRTELNEKLKYIKDFLFTLHDIQTLFITLYDAFQIRDVQENCRESYEEF